MATIKSFKQNGEIIVFGKQKSLHNEYRHDALVSTNKIAKWQAVFMCDDEVIPVAENGTLYIGFNEGQNICEAQYCDNDSDEEAELIKIKGVVLAVWTEKDIDAIDLHEVSLYRVLILNTVKNEKQVFYIRGVNLTASFTKMAFKLVDSYVKNISQLNNLDNGSLMLLPDNAVAQSDIQAVIDETDEINEAID